MGKEQVFIFKIHRIVWRRIIRRRRTPKRRRIPKKRSIARKRRK